MMRRILSNWTAAVLLVVIGVGATTVSGAEQVKGSGIRLGAWYCAGPFKDELFGLHLKSFKTVFPPEKQVIAAGGGLVDLSTTWEVEKLPGMTSTARRWVKFDDWSDGYVNQLPVGPPPMRNETCYLYRTITAKAAGSVEMRVLAVDNVKAWLNGKELAVAGNPGRAGASRFPAGLIAKLDLASGDNRLMVKITSMHGRHGFAFAIPSLTPSSDTPPGGWVKLYGQLPPGDEPYARSGKIVVPKAMAAPGARERVKAFRFDIAPIPMYDPARLKMVEALERTAAVSSGGQAYLKAVAALKPKLSGDAVAAAGRIEKMWREQIRGLAPIAFVRCPPYRVNAIAPYIARGAGPASICVFDPSDGKEPLRVIYDRPGLCIFDMNLSYDAKTIFFAARNGGGPWHIYEIGVDGKGLKQITDGPSSDISPAVLPSGEIMFVSTRAGTRVVCQKQPSGLLYVCNRDGSNVRRVSGNTLSDHTPQVMSDGRVLFTRWDYGVDKNVFCRQNLWTMNPDGTRFALFGSNTKEDPNSFWEARAIPGRPEVVCVFGPHHSDHAGMIGLVWDRPVGFRKDIRGEGFRWVTREMPAVGDTTLPWGYQDPWPINERLFLVSYGGDGGRKNRLYLLDDRGNRKCIYEADGKMGCWDPMLLRRRKTPPVIPNQSTPVEYAHRTPAQANLNPNDKLTGTFLLQDVYEGIGPGVKRGEVKSLAIIEQVPKYGDPAGAQIWGYSPTIGRGTMYVRRIIGTVPVEADGSAHFTAPAIRDISFNALDADGRLIRHMGSTLHIMPGETQSCFGCHETRGKVPARGPSAVIAAKRPPSVPNYPSWTERGILDFTKVVQPVLDRHCIKCHSGPTPAKGVDLSGDKTHSHSMAYDQLLDRGMVHYVPVAGTGHGESSPKARGSYVSKIRKHIETDFCVPKPLPPEDRRRIYTWIDANVPYFGTYEFTNSRVMGGRDRWYVTDKRKWFRRDFEPAFNRRCMPCHKRHITPQTYNYNPRGKGQILVTSKIWNDIALSSFQLGHGRISMIGQIGPVHRINLTHPEWSQMLTAPLAKSAGGMGLCKASGGGAVFKDKADGDYKAIRQALTKGHQTLMADPRVDMPEALKLENLEKARAKITAADTWQRRSDNWISKNATYQASSIIPKWTTDKEKLLNGKPYDNDWAFCSENEASPYITITLDKAYAIDEVHIVNRVNSCQEFARTLTMWLSTDAKTWTKTWSAGGKARADWHVELPKTPKAKYIKLGLTETQYLDLKYVFIYGK